MDRFQIQSEQLELRLFTPETKARLSQDISFHLPMRNFPIYYYS